MLVIFVSPSKEKKVFRHVPFFAGRERPVRDQRRRHDLLRQVGVRPAYGVFKILKISFFVPLHAALICDLPRLNSLVSVSGLPAL